MKLSVAAALALAASSCSAFAPTTFGTRQSSTMLSMAQEGTTRSQFLQQSLAAAASFAVLPQSANAAKYGGFGAGSPEVLDPKSAEVDADILASDAVQKALGAVKSYASSVKAMQDTLSADSQADIGPKIRKDFDFAQLRADLNTVNSAFDEDTQRGTDRLIRIVMQDITELETANRQKDGVARSERRLDIMKGKLDKLGKAFNDFLAFV
eukprot:CAMPEP_0197439034 /NCGR_PEP_ID=MMETSP1175-20131217/5861_1 /TAXON_ID=1003142 /ORGANISM="Triceratium dubium, Strain CCMP147" /LENGTH=209 /DNA_ID=CAMNT_0042968861 /DNA_START=68 /DNA_END=697 /DNA_ORIENTATION=+